MLIFFFALVVWAGRTRRLEKAVLQLPPCFHVLLRDLAHCCGKRIAADGLLKIFLDALLLRGKHFQAFLQIVAECGLVGVAVKTDELGQHRCIEDGFPLMFLFRDNLQQYAARQVFLRLDVSNTKLDSSSTSFLTSSSVIYLLISVS